MTEPKLPAFPPADLAARTPDWATRKTDEVLWTILETGGPHPRRFDERRSFGPLPSGRFDPHPEGPPSDVTGEGVSYAASTLLTAVAERYQHQRALTAHDSNEPAAYAWHPGRPLRLVDLTGPGAIRLGASHEINSGPKHVTRRWARGLRLAWPEADGLLYTSPMTGQPAIALWAPAADAFPPAPAFARLMSSPEETWRTYLLDICIELGYDWVP